MRLHCTIPLKFDSGPTTLKMYYTNDTFCLNCSSDYIQAGYYKMNKSTGVISTISAASTTSGTNDGTYQSISATFTDSYDQSTYIYYVIVILFRSANNASQQLFGGEVY